MDALATQWSDNFKSRIVRVKGYVMRLQSNLMTDSLGRVTALVNASALMDIEADTDVDRLVDAPPIGTIMPVEYVESMPTIFGIPIWEKLEGEPMEFFELFKQYRSLPVATKESRSIFRLATQAGVDVKQLEVLRQTYHWTVRCQAFDLYRKQEREYAMELRQQEVEGRHSREAAKLFGISTKYLTEHQELLTPKLAVQLLEVASKLERLSAGMADASKSSYGTPQQINIQNTVGQSSGNIISAPSIVGEDQKQNKTRLEQLVNIMNEIGVFEEPVEDESNIIDVDCCN